MRHFERMIKVVVVLFCLCLSGAYGDSSSPIRQAETRLKDAESYALQVCKKYKHGLANGLELLEAEENVVRAKLELIRPSGTANSTGRGQEEALVRALLENLKGQVELELQSGQTVACMEKQLHYLALQIKECSLLGVRPAELRTEYMSVYKDYLSALRRQYDHGLISYAELESRGNINPAK